MGQSDLLPMSFGIIADGREDVERILDANGAALGERLQFVHGRVEMGLRVSWNVPNIFEYFVSTHPELRDLRDRLFQGGAVPSPDDKIELGRRFDRALQVDRALCLRKVVGLIESACFAIKENEPRTECDVDEPRLPRGSRRSGGVRGVRLPGGRAVRQQFRFRLQRPLAAVYVCPGQPGSVETPARPATDSEAIAWC